jgi:predicted outer membrane repeat protein
MSVKHRQPWFRRELTRRKAYRQRKLFRCEQLEDRRLLAVITVDTLTDEADGSIADGDVSLRDAIAVAADDDTIDFGESLDGGTILLTMGELAVTRSLTIDATALPGGLIIDASGSDPTPDEDNGDGSRIFNIDDGDPLTRSEVTLTGLTLSGGDVDGHGGAIRSTETVTMTSSTISGNSAGRRGGGIYGGDYGDVTVTSSTISDNSAGGAGGGILTRSSTLSLDNSIVAANRDNGDATDVGFRLTATNSLIGDNKGTGLSEAPIGMPDENGNLVGDPNGQGIIDPLLSPLGNFGGSTQTHALLPGSPAINAGDPNFVAPPDHDQRGAPFVRVSGGRIDMGAFESQIAPVDFNNDDQLDCDDVDALVAAIVAGDDPTEFDLTGDEAVDLTDLDVWLALAGLENLPTHKALPAWRR